MRRPFLRVRARLAGSAALTLALLLAATSQGQETSGDASSLARYVPKDGLTFYLEYQGLDAHADAWQKTAAYKILNNTPTGEMLETLAAQFFDKTIHPGLSGTELVALIKYLARSGFLIAVVGSPDDPTKAPLVFVLRNGFKDKSIRPIVAKLLQSLGAPNTKQQAVTRAGHKVITGSTAQGRSFTWWVEDSKKEDVVFLLNKPEQADVILETLDGNRPSAIGHPRRVELAKPKEGFVPTGMAFLDPKAFVPEAVRVKLKESESFKRFEEKFKRFEKDYGYLGIFNFSSADVRWGFQDEALMSVVRIATSGPRKGLLAFLDNSTFDKTKLPPIPPNVTGFTVASFDIAGSLDRLRSQVKALDLNADEMVDKLVAVVKEKTKLRLKEDILSHLGPRVAWYILPSKASSTPAPAGTNMLSMMMAGAGMDQIPKLAIVCDIDDPVAFGKVLDELMATINRELKAQAASKAQGDAPEAKGARNRGPAAPSMEFRLMPGETKMYVMSVPSELSSQFPASLRPTIRVGPKHVAFAVSADIARLALEVKGGWTPPGDLASAFQGLPSRLKMLSLDDPRDTLPGVLAALPGKIQAAYNTAILLKTGGANPAGGPPGQPGAPSVPGSGGQPGVPSRPGPIAGVQGGSGGSGGGLSMPPGMQPPGSNKPTGGPPTLSFQIDASKLPSADAIKSLLFPSIYSVEVDDEEITITSRVAFPNIGDPSKMGAMTSAMPMLKGMSGIPPGMSPPPGATPPGASPPPGSAPPGSAPPAAPGGRPGMRRPGPG